jgi:hypothetical protein
MQDLSLKHPRDCSSTLGKVLACTPGLTRLCISWTDTHDLPLQLRSAFRPALDLGFSSLRSLELSNYPIAPYSEHVLLDVFAACPHLHHVHLPAAMPSGQLSLDSWIGPLQGPSWTWINTLRTLDLSDNPALGLPSLELLSSAVCKQSRHLSLTRLSLSSTCSPGAMIHEDLQVGFLRCGSHSPTLQHRVNHPEA